jgi:bifunctional non-homologous end joining protein LigD
VGFANTAPCDQFRRFCREIASSALLGRLALSAAPVVAALPRQKAGDYRRMEVLGQPLSARPSSVLDIFATLLLWQILSRGTHGTAFDEGMTFRSCVAGSFLRASVRRREARWKSLGKARTPYFLQRKCWPCLMSLANYNKKRNFTRTPEPKGKAAKAGAPERRFVVQKHDASRLHYDFRLELDGTLKSWAVPKGPSLDPARKNLAVQVEDHPIDYGDFEGVIPEGNYGGGTVLLWDRGTWEPLHDPVEGYRQGKLHFILHGTKLKGEWSLVRMHSRNGDGDKNWLLMKLKDKFANGKADILKTAPDSVKSRRSIETIADERENVWSSDAKKTAQIPAARKSALPQSLSPQLAVLAAHPPAGDEWLHEIKFDGYRILAFIKSGKVTLRTRNGLDYTAKFPQVATALGKLKVDTAVLDGEVVVLDQEGRSDFQGLQAMLKHKTKVTPVYYAFDLPFCSGSDLRESPLVERKKQLEQILPGDKNTGIVRYSEHVTGKGDAMIDKACSLSLEGIVSKKADAPYVSRRAPTWLKSKCDHRQEFVIVGYSDPQGSRQGFGSLLLGYHQDGELVYAGRVGTGFDGRLLDDLFKQLKAKARKTAPVKLPAGVRQSDVHWVEPQLVGEVRFTGWTRDGLLRHPAFIALRSDKAAKEIVRETPVEPPNGATKGDRKSKASRARTTSPGPAQKAAPMSRGPTGASASETVLSGIRLTHPDKVFFPESGTTKKQLAEYYERAGEWMLPHVVSRPLALVRCPEGRGRACFFQRNWSTTLPAAIDQVDVSDAGKKEIHVGVHDLAGVISLVQIGVLELHTWNCRSKNIEHPDQLIFDLDPGSDVQWSAVVEGAKAVGKALDKLQLPTFLKTSGGKGLHITIPIKPNINWDDAKSFCETIAKDLVSRSDLFVANMRKDLRGGKIYIDYHRNGRGATAVAPYSTRAREGAPVSMPISWKELGKLNSAAHFKVESARRYLEQRKADPWQQFEASRVDVRKLVGG